MRIEEIRTALAKRLRARRTEIEQAALTRINAVSEAGESTDPAYRDGLRAAVSAALEYGIEAVERSPDRPPPMPTVLLAQARLAARHGVKLETVLRRYLAGYTLLGDFLIEESERGGRLNGASLKRLLRVQASLLDRLIAAVSEEYGREAEPRPSSTVERRVERVQRLLAGELLDTFELAYDFDAHHLGAIAIGPAAPKALRKLATTLDCNHLSVPHGESVVWAWFGGRRSFELEEIERAVSQCWPTGATLVLGEQAHGLAGWRLTHRQAQAALPIATRSREAFVRYADVALLASMLQDDLLAVSLRELYLAPLQRERDGGEIARQTLRAYFDTDRNSASAAAALGVTRQTVNNRLRAIEGHLGRSINACAHELTAALHLEEFSFTTSPSST